MGTTDAISLMTPNAAYALLKRPRFLPQLGIPCSSEFPEADYLGPTISLRNRTQASRRSSLTKPGVVQQQRSSTSVTDGVVLCSGAGVGPGIGIGGGVGRHVSPRAEPGRGISDSMGGGSHGLVPAQIFSGRSGDRLPLAQPPHSRPVASLCLTQDHHDSGVSRGRRLPSDPSALSPVSISQGKYEIGQNTYSVPPLKRFKNVPIRAVVRVSTLPSLEACSTDQSSTDGTVDASPLLANTDLDRPLTPSDFEMLDAKDSVFGPKLLSQLSGRSVFDRTFEQCFDPDFDFSDRVSGLRVLSAVMFAYISQTNVPSVESFLERVRGMSIELYSKRRSLMHTLLSFYYRSPESAQNPLDWCSVSALESMAEKMILIQSNAEDTCRNDGSTESDPLAHEALHLSADLLLIYEVHEQIWKARSRKLRILESRLRDEYSFSLDNRVLMERVRFCCSSSDREGQHDRLHVAYAILVLALSCCMMGTAESFHQFASDTLSHCTCSRHDESTPLSVSCYLDSFVSILGRAVGCLSSILDAHLPSFSISEDDASCIFHSHSAEFESFPRRDSRSRIVAVRKIISGFVE